MNNKIVSGSYDKTVRFWNLPSQEVILQGHTESIRYVMISKGKNISFLEAPTTLSECGILRIPSSILTLAIRRDNKYAVSGSKDKSVGCGISKRNPRSFFKRPYLFCMLCTSTIQFIRRNLLDRFIKTQYYFIQIELLGKDYVRYLKNDD